MDDNGYIVPAFTKFGPKFDYRGAHAVLELRGQTLLGEIRTVYRDEYTGAVLCVVRYFCGEEWPTRPALSALKILPRDYPDE